MMLTNEEKVVAADVAQSVIDSSHRISPKFSEEMRMKNREYFLAAVLLNVLAENKVLRKGDQ